MKLFCRVDVRIERFFSGSTLPTYLLSSPSLVKGLYASFVFKEPGPFPVDLFWDRDLNLFIIITSQQIGPLRFFGDLSRLREGQKMVQEFHGQWRELSETRR